MSERRVLHVAPSSHVAARRVAEAMITAGYDVTACPDVYRALARMGGLARGGLCAVVVCVDLMDAGQFEFFQLAARHHRRVPVYVHGQGHAQSRMELALRMGAKDVIEPDAIERVLPSRGPAAATASDRPATARPVERESVPLGPADADTDEEPRDADAASDPDAPAGPARVPWLRYEGGPRRVPPKPGEPLAEPSPPTVEPEPPLLSPEELEALIGDDNIGDSGNGRGKRRRRP